jgi:hypothetical protein
LGLSSQLYFYRHGEGEVGISHDKFAATVKQFIEAFGEIWLGGFV